MMIKKGIKEIREYIFAENESLVLEHRLFLHTIIVGTLVSTLGGIINLILRSSPISVIVPLLLSVSLIIIYYFARVKKIVTPFITPIIIVAILATSTIWVFNGGINGSNILPAFIVLILGVLIVPNKIKKYIIILFIAANITILLIQFYRPDLIVNFPTETDRWIDNLVTVIYASYFIYLIISFVHKNYTFERQKVEKSKIRLDQLNADKDRFIYILGHDLKNPFNNIIGFSELLTDGIDSLNKDEIIDIAEKINKSAQITNKLLEDILVWARSQQGKIPYNPQILNINDICTDTIELLLPNAKAKNISINCLTSDHINIYADINMIKTVLRNLVSNAIKFTNKNGTIIINAMQTDSDVTISVSDNGIGIEHDDLRKLFDMSHIVTTNGTEKETGTGLGLLLCKEFVEKHSGKIWAESEPGKGSEFKFTLPISSDTKNHHDFVKTISF